MMALQTPGPIFAPLTPAGHSRIREELRVLHERRRHVADQIRDAMAAGELGENAQYEDAKLEQSFVETRIRDLKEVLAASTILDPEAIPTDWVGVGSVVRLRDAGGDEWEVALVGSFEADPEQDRISVECPLGRVLLGCSPGQAVSVQVPDGTAQYQVVAIRRPDAWE